MTAGTRDSVKHHHGRQVHQALVPQVSFGYIQNHDQIGNRAKGERLQQIVGTQKARLAAAVVFTAPFLPMIFMGEEWGGEQLLGSTLPTSKDPELRAQNVSEGRKRDFPALRLGQERHPRPGGSRDVQALEAAVVRAGSSPNTSAMFQWYRDLIHLRRKTLALNLGDFMRHKVLLQRRGPLDLHRSR